MSAIDPPTALAAYWFPDLEVTAVDTGGSIIHVYATDPTRAIAKAVPAVHVLNVWDHEGGRRDPVTASSIRAAVVAWWNAYPDGAA